MPAKLPATKSWIRKVEQPQRRRYHALHAWQPRAHLSCTSLFLSHGMACHLSYPFMSNVSNAFKWFLGMIVSLARWSLLRIPEKKHLQQPCSTCSCQSIAGKQRQVSHNFILATSYCYLKYPNAHFHTLRKARCISLDMHLSESLVFNYSQQHLRKLW